MTGVEQAAPALAAPRRTFGPLACALLGLAFLAPALVARGLTSDARGYGTHCQLWLPPCTLKTLTGIPCPFCGMTTSFAFIAHGRIREGAATQPVGALLFATTILVGLALLGIAFRTIFVGRFEKLAVVGYVLMGWLMVVGFKEMQLAIPSGGVFHHS